MNAPNPDDWTTGPAKWAALIVLGSGSLLGLGWSIANHAPSPRPRQGEVPRERSEQDGEGASVRPPTAPAQAGSDDEGGQDGATSPSLAPVKIDINSASAAELELLPRIGPTLAARIVADRDANGPFDSLDDLRRVNGIGPRTVEQVTPYAEACTQTGSP